MVKITLGTNNIQNVRRIKKVYILIFVCLFYLEVVFFSIFLYQSLCISIEIRRIQLCCYCSYNILMFRLPSMLSNALKSLPHVNSTCVSIYRIYVFYIMCFYNNYIIYIYILNMYNIWYIESLYKIWTPLNDSILYIIFNCRKL